MSDNLDKLRIEINEIDQKIIKLLSERFKLMPLVAKEKKKMGKEVFDDKREAEVIEKRTKMFEENGINDSAFVKDLYNLIMKKSKDIQKDIL